MILEEVKHNFTTNSLLDFFKYNFSLCSLLHSLAYGWKGPKTLDLFTENHYLLYDQATLSTSSYCGWFSNQYSSMLTYIDITCIYTYYHQHSLLICSYLVNITLLNARFTLDILLYLGEYQIWLCWNLLFFPCKRLDF